MIFLAALVLMLLHTSYSERIQREIGENCTTPDSEVGQCRNIKNCPVLLEYIKQVSSNGSSTSASSFLRESNCGFEGLDPLVCCPELSSRLTPWDDFQNRNRSQSRVTTRRPSSGLSNRYTTECGKSNFQIDRIVGGTSASLGAWPWITALGYRSRTRSGVQWLCGGALVTNRHVITAGHCVEIPADKTLYMVRLGDLDLDSESDGASPVDIEVERAFAHPDYRSTAKVNDIAIVKMKNSVQFNEYIQPICLPNIPAFRSNPLVGRSPYVAGWGALIFRGPATKALQQVDVVITDESSCRNAYRSQRGAVIDHKVVCAGNSGKDACQGDSGGPLMLDEGATYYLVGVVSYGKNCAEPGYPGIYTRVTAFMDWINSNLN